MKTGTQLHFRVKDARSNEDLIADDSNGAYAIFDLSTINAFDHPSIYLQADLLADSDSTAHLQYWELSWKELEHPDLYMPIPDLEVMEDTTPVGILDLRHYFIDNYTDLKETEFFFDLISAPDKIYLGIQGPFLNINHIEDNFTGHVYLRLGCRNVYWLTCTSNLFKISVRNINDPPAWEFAMQDIFLKEDTAYCSRKPITERVVDSEKDPLVFEIEYSNSKLDIELGEDGYLRIVPERNYFGKSELTIRAFEKYHSVHMIHQKINVTVSPVDDPLAFNMIHPLNNSIVFGNSVELKWRIFDQDDDLSNFTFNLGFGTRDPPMMSNQVLYSTSINITDLEINTTYYWTICPFDGKTFLKELAQVYSFRVAENNSGTSEVSALKETKNLPFNIRCDQTYASAYPGEKVHYRLTLVNNDTLPVDVQFFLGGEFIEYSKGLADLVVSPGCGIRISLYIDIPLGTLPGAYSMPMTINHTFGSHRIELMLKVRGGENSSVKTPDPEPSTNDDRLSFPVLLLSFLSLLGSIGAVVLYRKRAYPNSWFHRK